MQIRTRHYVRTVIVTAALGLASPAICRGQEPVLAALTTPPVTTPASLLSPVTEMNSGDQAIEPLPSIGPATRTVRPQRLGVMLPLYASFAGLQALDAHSTVRALQNGGTESNPLLRGLAGNPTALFALKAGVTTSTILLTERLRPKHRVGAIVLMAALNSVYAAVVVHNYRAIP